jgi:DNA-binding LacI/PurR family transcriptional regulator
VFSDFADAATVRQMFRSDLVVMMNARHDRLSPAVIPDEAIGIEAAIADAAAKGVRRAGLVTGRASSPLEHLRIAGYRAAFARHGIVETVTVQGDYSYASGHRAAAALAVERAELDAVFCTSDSMAMGLLDACRADFPGNRPARFRLYGFDNLSLTDFDAYPISSIGYDKTDYVRQMLRYLAQPSAFVPGETPASVPTHYFPRLTG